MGAGTPRSPASSCPHSPRSATGQAVSIGLVPAGNTAVASWACSPAAESDVEVLSAQLAAEQAAHHTMPAPLWNVEVIPCGPGSYTAAGGLEDPPCACSVEASRRRPLPNVGGVAAAESAQGV